MERREGLPTVVILGRPNVGKSTLFNRILGNRRAIVGDEPGITRDRIVGEAEFHGKRFRLIDTGGLLVRETEAIPAEIFRQARRAIEEADRIIFLLDGRTEITGTDTELAQMLQKLGKPVTVAVNKIDVPSREALAHEFFRLGFEHVFPVSAEHGLGIEELLERVTQEFPAGEATAREAAPLQIKVAIVGRPNVGKSTLLNALTGADRAIVSSAPGTTRDAVDESVLRDGVEYVFVDTAGIRRKGKTRLMAEKLSVVMAQRHLRMAQVVLVVLDATTGVVNLDATIGGYAHESGRSVILCVNKWDAAPSKDKAAFVEQLRWQLKFLDYAPIAFLSAKTGAGVSQLFPLIRRGYEAASKRIPTGELNRFLGSLEFDKDLHVKYITQVGVRPPTFVVFTDQARELHFSTQRYLANRIREEFGFPGTPIVIKERTRPKREFPGAGRKRERRPKAGRRR